MTTTPPGWYPDAQGTTRWWDGTRWTEHTQPAAPTAGPPAPPAAPAPGQQTWGQQAQQSWAQNTYQAMQGQQRQQGQPGQQQWGQQQWGQAYASPAAAKKKVSPGLVAGIGGGLVVLLIAAIVTLVVTNDDDSEQMASADSSESADPVEQSDEPTDEASDATEEPTQEPSEEPSEEPSADKSEHGAALPPAPSAEQPTEKEVRAAPRDASAKDYCEAKNQILDIDPSDQDAYLAYQWNRVKVGVPATIPKLAFEAFVQDLAGDYFTHHNYKVNDKAIKSMVNYEAKICY